MEPLVLSKIWSFESLFVVQNRPGTKLENVANFNVLTLTTVNGSHNKRTRTQPLSV